MRFAPILAVLALAPLLAPPSSASTAVSCFGVGSNVAQPYDVEVAGQSAAGLYAWPTNLGDTLVLVNHGYGGKASTMGSTLTTLSRAGAVAVAMDYRGLSTEYKVFTGAQDVAAAVHDFQAQCPNLTRVVLWGTSMGGHISALAIMQNPGLADYLVDDVGPSNIPELLATLVPGGVVYGASYGWSEATAPLAPDPCKDPTVTTSNNACLAGITLVNAVAAAYAGREADLVASSPALNPTAWAGAGLARAYLLYEAADPIVPPDHGTQLQATLAAQGIPVTMYAVPFRGTFRTPDPGAPGLYPNGINGLGLPDHQSAGKELVLKIVAKTIAATAQPVLTGTYTPETGDPLPTALVRSGDPTLDAALAPAYALVDPSIKSAQYQVGRFTPAP
ncbi:MAG: hypothetical protein QOD77_824 [Thermoplasmata archaeon]|jgi:dienelactone hydrolase|nr:hypothetical protein [Thermoplasmata archaeon]